MGAFIHEFRVDVFILANIFRESLTSLSGKLINFYIDKMDLMKNKIISKDLVYCVQLA